MLRPEPVPALLEGVCDKETYVRLLLLLGLFTDFAGDDGGHGEQVGEQLAAPGRLALQRDGLGNAAGEVAEAVQTGAVLQGLVGAVKPKCKGLS